MDTMITAKSIQGRRDYQQDCYGFLQRNDLTFLVMCDGNGEHGEKASKLATKVALRKCAICSAGLENVELKEQSLKKIGHQILATTSSQVREFKDLHELPEPGTTITLIILTNEYIGTFWIGDSPAYLMSKHDDEMEALINPHTLAEKLIDEGMSRDELENQPGINSVLIKCAGYEDDNPDSDIRKANKSGLLLVGSDGFFNGISPDEITEIFDDDDNYSD